MAKRKHHKRRSPRKTMSASPKRRRPIAKGLLNDMMNPTVAKSSLKTVLISGLTGWGSTFVNKALPNSWGKLARIAVGGAGGFILASMVNPSAGSGFMGGMTALNTVGMLSDDMEETEFADENSLQDKPLYLDEQGSPFVIEEEGGQSYTRYLSDAEINTLSEDVKEELRLSAA